jgi:hypothetical protein
VVFMKDPAVLWPVLWLLKKDLKPQLYTKVDSLKILRTSK